MSILEQSPDRTEEKVLLVPLQQIGYEILQALAASGHGWLNIRHKTLAGYASWIVQCSESTAPQVLKASSLKLLVDKLLHDSGLSHSDPLGMAGSSIARTIKDLRSTQASPDAVNQAASSEFSRAVGSIYSDYVSYLNANEVLDETGLFSKAAHILRSDDHLRPAGGVIILDEVEVPLSAMPLLHLIRGSARQVWRIGSNLSTLTTPPHVARTRLGDWPLPSGGVVQRSVDLSVSREVARIDGDSNREGPCNPIDILTAIGAENEVRAVFRRIAAEHIPFDQVEVAYTANQPYLSLIRTLASRYGIPTTLAAGIPALSTRVGQSIRQFLQWISGGCSPQDLVRMLRGGFVHVGLDKASGGSFSLEAADILCNVRVTKGTSTIVSALRAMIEASTNDAAMSGRSEDSDDRIDGVIAALTPLLELATMPGSISMRDLTERIQQFVNDFVLPGSRDLVSVRQPEFSESPDFAIEPIDRLVFQDLLTRLSQMGLAVPGRLPLSVLLGRTQELLAEAFVLARAAVPGHLHVVPLSSAGFNGCPRLFVIGLDETTMGKAIGEDPLLSDAARKALSESTGTRMALSTDQTDLHSWTFNRAVERTTQKVTIVYSCYDVAQDRVLYPSSTVLELTGKEASIANAPVPDSWIPTPDEIPEMMPMDLMDVFLASGNCAQARESCIQHHAWVDRGRQAQINRKSLLWTAHDGVLVGHGTEANPFSSEKRLSASRLETMATCPFRYFLKYVLKLDTRDQLDEDKWLSPLERGQLVHRVLAAFMSDRVSTAEKLSSDHLPELQAMFMEEADKVAEYRQAPGPSTADAERRELCSIAASFVHDEIERQRYVEPVAFELGFGLSSLQDDSTKGYPEAVELDFDGLHLRLVGKVDRIDRLLTGGIAITDYKTGSSSSFNSADPLNKGRSLQWALYAYAIEHIFGETTLLSGYLFPNSRELGLRIEADPAHVRETIGEDFRSYDRLAEAGYFIQAPEQQGACRYCDYRAVCGDIPVLEKAIREKLGATRPQEENFASLENWRYAKKKLGSLS